MVSPISRPQLRRIYRQTLTLCHKNFLIFYKAPISTLLRALIFPIAVTLVFCFLKRIQETSSYYDKGNNWGIADAPFPIKDLSDAMNSAGSDKIVFVRNGFPTDTFNSIVTGVQKQPGMANKIVVSTDDPNNLFDYCKQSLQGRSDCFAAVLFETYNDTTIQYTIALDSSLNSYGYGNFRTGDTTFNNIAGPISWAVNKQAGNLEDASKPTTQPFGGYFRTYTIEDQRPVTHAEFWYVE